MTKPVPQISMSFSWEPRKPLGCPLSLKNNKTTTIHKTTLILAYLGLSNLSCQDIIPKFPWSPHQTEYDSPSNFIILSLKQVIHTSIFLSFSFPLSFSFFSPFLSPFLSFPLSYPFHFPFLFPFFPFFSFPFPFFPFPFSPFPFSLFPFPFISIFAYKQDLTPKFPRNPRQKEYEYPVILIRAIYLYTIFKGINSTFH